MRDPRNSQPWGDTPPAVEESMRCCAIFFSRYISVSACRSRSEALVGESAIAVPTDAVIEKDASPIATGWLTEARTRAATDLCLGTPGVGAEGPRTRRRRCGRRGRRSDGGDNSLAGEGDQRVADIVSEGVVDALESVEVDEEQGQLALRASCAEVRSSSSMRWRRLGSPVRASCMARRASSASTSEQGTLDVARQLHGFVLLSPRRGGAGDAVGPRRERCAGRKHVLDWRSSGPQAS